MLIGEDDTPLAFATRRRKRKNRSLRTVPDTIILESTAIHSVDMCVGTDAEPELCNICCTEQTTFHVCAESAEHTSCMACFESTIRNNFDTDTTALPGCCWSPHCNSSFTAEQLLRECSAETRVAYLQHLSAAHTIQCGAAEARGYESGYKDCTSMFGTFEAYKKEALDIIIIRCPSCPTPYYEWTSCGAVTCSHCHAFFCVACRKVFNSDGGTHDHIRRGRCKSLPTTDAYHFSREAFAIAQRLLVEPPLYSLLNSLPIDVSSRLRSFLRTHHVAGPTLAMMGVKI